MRQVLIFAAVMLVAATPSRAQTALRTRAPVESVTVTGTKAQSREIIRNYVGTASSPTAIIGKIARWKDGVCPIAIGLKPAFTKFLTDRVRRVAAQVDAPVASDNCAPNVEIVFTTKPQALLDDIRQHHPLLIGYHRTAKQGEEMAQMRHAIQSWYAIQTEDYLGNRQLDEEQHNPGVILAGGTFPNAHLYNVSGSRLRDGLSSQFYHVLIVANPDQLVRQEMGALSDYIAMLALTQPEAADVCPALPSILGLLVQGCANVTASITDADLAFLRALYHMTPDTLPSVQRNALISGMDEAIRPPPR